jgi:hypothetical protein
LAISKSKIAWHGECLARSVQHQQEGWRPLPEALGKWLTAEEYIGMWDVLVVSRLDRLSRSVFTYADLIRWCEEHASINK